MKTLNEVVQYHEKDIRETIESGGSVTPKIVAVSTDGLLMHFDYGSRPTDDDGEAKLRETVLMTLIAMRLAGVLEWAVFTGEAWFSRRQLKDPMFKLRASEDPDRREGVFLHAWTVEGKKFASWEIDRSGPKPKLVQLAWVEGQTSSWIDKAFRPIPPPPAEAVRAARMILDKLKKGAGVGRDNHDQA
jgi:hypothetical protein